MNIEGTIVLDKNARAYRDKKRVIINQGGSGSSKTYSILQLLICIGMGAKEQTTISVVSESRPHLRRGVLRDIKNILQDAWNDNDFNKTDLVYYFPKAVLEFFPADDSRKLRGARRDILFINECNNVTKDSYNELEVRTKRCVFLDFNPVYEFWAHSLVGQPGVEFIKSTYLDARAVLPQAVVDSIESRRATDPNWWRVYGLGEIGNIEGLVHPLFDQVEQMPEDPKAIDFYGLDFGFSQDPAALVHCRVIGQDLYKDQLIYETGMTNDVIAKRMETLGVRQNYDEIFADGAEPKSIEEIRRYGFNIKPAPKGQGSVTSGIQRVNQYRQHWTKRSLDGIKEQRNYRFIVDGLGKITDKPIDDSDHLMSAVRYACAGKLTEVDRWVMGSVFHTKPNTDPFTIESVDAPYMRYLYGLTYLEESHRIYGVKLAHNTINDSVCLIQSQEFSMIQPLANWVKTSATFQCFGGAEFGSDALKSLYLIMNGKPNNLHLNVVSDIDEAGIIMHINTMLINKRFFVAADSSEFRALTTATDTKSPLICALFPAIDSLYRRKRKPVEPERTIFHKRYEERMKANVMSNGFVS